MEVSHEVGSVLEPYAAPKYAPQVGMPRALTAQPLVRVGSAALEGATGPARARTRGIRKRTEMSFIVRVRMSSLGGRRQGTPHEAPFVT